MVDASLPLHPIDHRRNISGKSSGERCLVNFVKVQKTVNLS